jgi:diguanylate cyclase (GGDEF)-like protein
MSEPSSTVPGPSASPITDPVTQISAAVRQIVSGPGADELVAQIAAILASAMPEDVERVALENVQLQHELELLQSVDPLTGLRNRQRFFEDLRREVAAARRYESPLSLVVLDVDGLRTVNETRGYDAGDRLLLTLGELLLTRLRVTDIAARIGDDDFAVILPRTPGVGAESLAGRIAETLGDWVDIGIAALDATVTSGSDLLERADRDLAERRTARTRPPAA